MTRPAEKRFAFYFGILAYALVSTTATNARAQSNTLKWKLEQDAEFSVVMVQSSKSETIVDARETTVESATTIRMDWRVTDVDREGDATIEQSLTSVKLSVTGFTRQKKGETAAPLLTISFDTAAPEGVTNESRKLMNQIVPLLGLKLDVVMSPSGEIKKVSVSEEVSAQLDKLPDTQKLRELFSRKGLIDLMGSASVVLPEDLTVGQSWTDNSTSSTGLGTFERIRTYTFVGKKTVDGKELAEFSVTAVLGPTQSPERKTGDNHGLDGKLIEFNGSGTLLLDIEGGFFKSSTIENRGHSEKPYREKTIETVVSNQIEMTVTKK